MKTLDSIINKSLVYTIAKRLQRKSIDVFSLYDRLGIDLDRVEVCNQKNNYEEQKNNYIVLNENYRNTENNGNVFNSNYVATENEDGTFEIIIDYAEVEAFNNNIEITIINSLGVVISEANYTHVNEPILQMLIITLSNLEQEDLTGTVSLEINGNG